MRPTAAAISFINDLSKCGFYAFYRNNANAASLIPPPENAPTISPPPYPR